MARGRPLVLAGFILVMLGPSAPAPAARNAGCDLWASEAGSDANPGTESAPVREIDTLIARLAPGQTGCLRAGDAFDNHGQGFGESVVVDGGGLPGAPITIRSAPGPRASVRGQIWLRESSHDLVFTEIDFGGVLGTKKTSHLIVHGDRIRLESNDISYPLGICVNAGGVDAYGSGTGPVADAFVLEGNRIHDCGSALGPADLDETDSGVHGVYLVNTTGARIVDNAIYDNVNRGIQLWPAARGTLIEFNVLDGNGSNLNIGACWESGCAGGLFSRETTVRSNVITHADLRSLSDPNVPQGDQASVYGNYPPNAGDAEYGNMVTGNCLFQPHRPDHTFGGSGYAESNNVIADPRYADRAGKDYRLERGSPCTGMGLRAPPETCPGRAAVRGRHVVGTRGRDRLRGTTGRDVLCGLGGDDRISGLGGRDLIVGGPGDDVLRGGPGRDRIRGGPGRDRCRPAGCRT